MKNTVCGRLLGALASHISTRQTGNSEAGMHGEGVRGDGKLCLWENQIVGCLASHISTRQTVRDAYGEGARRVSVRGR